MSQGYNEIQLPRPIARALVTTALVVLVVSLIAGLNYSGYCWKEGRYLDDQEIIDIAAGYVIRMPPSVIDVYERDEGQEIFVYRTTPKRPVGYKDLNEFYEVNKECCRLAKRGASLDFRLLGSVAETVRVEYLERYEDSDGDLLSGSAATRVFVSNCGEPDTDL